ncbi:MAG: hypothetical protein ACREDP_23845 [Bradyrhizobium sp.]
MRRFFAAAAVFVVASCSYSPPATNPMAGSEVGGTGGIKFSDEKLNDRKHMVTVTAAPGLGETEGSISQRLLVYANRIAAKTCPRDYAFSDDASATQPMAASFMQRTKIFVFTCK